MADRPTSLVPPSAGAPSPEAPAAAPDATTLHFSRGLAAWLSANDCSLAFTSYQAGKLFMVGRHEGGCLATATTFDRAMGLCVSGPRLFLASALQIYQLENVLRPGENANGAYDRLYVPRKAHATGDIDAHELAVDDGGRLILVNTSYSCLATLGETHAFTPIWKPAFISRLAPEDRCHLNGLAMDAGVPRFVTAISRSDVTEGWRDRRQSGGVLIEVETDRIVADDLSMPHSPRMRDGVLWVLDSGRGLITRIDPATGARRDLAFCPGFLRGLSFVGGCAVVTLSRPRGPGAFEGLEIADTLRRRDADAWCGVLVVDLESGDILEWIRLDGTINELFDVAVVPGARAPMTVAPSSDIMRTFITFDAEFAPLRPPTA